MLTLQAQLTVDKEPSAPHKDRAAAMRQHHQPNPTAHANQKNVRKTGINSRHRCPQHQQP